jgi:hypothetical protein
VIFKRLYVSPIPAQQTPSTFHEHAQRNASRYEPADKLPRHEISGRIPILRAALANNRRQSEQIRLELGTSQPLIPRSERSGLLTRIAISEGDSFARNCTEGKPALTYDKGHLDIGFLGTARAFKSDSTTKGRVSIKAPEAA